MSKTQIPTGGIADDAISEEHLDATAITGTTALAATPASTDEIIISDAGTLKRLDIAHLMQRPAFAVAKSSAQTITNNTSTKITFDTEYLDTESSFASNKFTCGSGQAGNYLMRMSLLFYKNSGNYIKATELAAYKNGGPITYGNDLGPANHSYISDSGDADITQIQAVTTFLITLAENDYVECYGKAITVNSGNPSVYNYYTSWSGFKLLT
jgi:hypothetical protein